MFISQSLKKENITAFLLYMWQVEDLIRAYGCDADRLRNELVPGFKNYTEEQRAQQAEWYANLVEMMHSEGVVEQGHLQINKNIITLLTDLHNALLHSAKQPFYSAAYYKALPFIVELRSKSQRTDIPELENCFEALYGVMLLRMQQKPISDDTNKAVTEMMHLLSLLADYYNQERQGTLEL